MSGFDDDGDDDVQPIQLEAAECNRLIVVAVVVVVGSSSAPAKVVIGQRVSCLFVLLFEQVNITTASKYLQRRRLGSSVAPTRPRNESLFVVSGRVLSK